MKTDVICIGLTCADVLIRGIDFSSPFIAETKPAKEVSFHVGGDAANQAIVLSHMGINTELVTGLGKDSIGDFCVNTFRGAGVDISKVIYAKAAPSSINVVIINADGQRNFINSGMPESVFFTPDFEQIKEAKVVSLGSMMMPPFTTVSIIEKTVKKAKQEGCIVCADVMFNPESCTLEELGKEVLSNIDYIFPNEDEARQLTGKTDLDEMADIFLRYGIKNVLIKIGKDGCFVKNKDIRKIFPAIAVKVVDTTGAGDNFAAGFITGLVEGKDLEGCVTLASATAGIAIQHMGANTGVKSREQVETYLRDTI